MIGSLGEVLSNQPFRWRCIDRLSSQVIEMWPNLPNTKNPTSNRRISRELCDVQGKMDKYGELRALGGTKLRQLFGAGGQRRFLLAECKADLARAHRRIVV